MGGQRHAPAALPPGETPGNHCTCVSLGSRAGLTGVENLVLTRIRSPDRRAPSLVAIPIELSRSQVVSVLVNVYLQP